MFPLMMTDSVDSSRPVFSKVNITDGIQAMFDDISYEKGSALIRMMSHFLGLDTFKKAIRVYLSSKAFQSVHHDDLYEIIAQQLKLDNKTLAIKEVMDTWILQMNYPLVTVSRVVNSSNTLNATQERFVNDRASLDPSKSASPFNYTWAIPLTLTSSEVISSQRLADLDIYWMGRHETHKILELKDGLVPQTDGGGWILANVEHIGYYRVNYDLENWKALCAQLMKDHKVIPAIHRAQIINDAWALEKNEYLPVDVAMATLDYLHNERDYLVWTAASGQLDYVLSMLAGGSILVIFIIRKFLRSKVEKLYAEFNVHDMGQSYQEIATSGKVFQLASQFGVKHFMEEAHSQFAKWMNNSKVNPIDPNLRSSVYCSAVAYGGYEECQFLLEMFKVSKDTYEKQNIFHALLCTEVPWILNSYLALTLNPSGLFNNQTFIQIIRIVADNPVGRTLAWNFYRANYDRLHELYGGSASSLIYFMVTNLNRHHELYQVEMFAKKLAIKNINSLTRTVRQNIGWITRNENTLDDLLKKRIKNVPGA
ncbi:hypothetical protein Btru_039386 [Bulinus truncatus]|nr:hypothetical protein Btru_039386 [Bulinus truncatus]